MRFSKQEFITEQGYASPARAVQEKYAALMFQPRVIGVAVAVGIAGQLSWVFWGLACVLTIAAVWPRWNAFDALYNAVVARWNGGCRLGNAPLPRRFAQALAATLLGSTALAIAGSMPLIAAVLEIILAGALLLLFAARACAGALLLHWLTRLAHEGVKSLYVQ